MENSTTFPKRPSLPAHSVHAVGADQTPHYVQAVMKVGSRSEIRVCEDIYTARGIQFLAKGVRIDARLWSTLSCHALSKPLDQLLAASDCIDHSIMPGMLRMLAVGEDDAVMRWELRITSDEMGRLLDGLAFEIERCVPADGKHGPLSMHIIGLLRQ